MFTLRIRTWNLYKVQYVVLIEFTFYYFFIVMFNLFNIMFCRVVHENETDNKLLSKNNQPQTETGQNDSSGKMGVLFFKLR